MWLAIANTGTRLRWQSNSPLIRCKFPGPHDPAHTAKRSLAATSAPAANAAASSCRTCMKRMRPSLVSSAWSALRLSPVKPHIRPTPYSASVCTISRAILVLMR